MQVSLIKMKNSRVRENEDQRKDYKRKDEFKKLKRQRSEERQAKRNYEG